MAMHFVGFKLNVCLKKIKIKNSMALRSEPCDVGTGVYLQLGSTPLPGEIPLWQTTKVQQSSVHSSSSSSSCFFLSSLADIRTLW